MKQNTLTIVSLLVAAGLIFFISTLSKPSTTATSPGKSENNAISEVVSMVDGKQIIEVTARGGYSPNQIVAKAGVPTILRMKTTSTFDCSSSFTIPSLGIQKMLPQTGVTDFEIPVKKPGENLAATCGMGMYRLNINFK